MSPRNCRIPDHFVNAEVGQLGQHPEMGEGAAEIDACAVVIVSEAGVRIYIYHPQPKFGRGGIPKNQNLDTVTFPFMIQSLTFGYTSTIVWTE